MTKNYYETYKYPLLHCNRYPMIYSDTPLPLPDPSGFTPVYVNNINPSGTDFNIRTYAAALQRTVVSCSPMDGAPITSRHPLRRRTTTDTLSRAAP